MNNMKNSVESFESSSSGLKLITTIQNERVCSMCLLRDGRLVSGGGYEIIIYKKDSFQSDIIIESYIFDCVYSVCGLKNGNLACSFGEYGDIGIYEINGNKYKEIHTIDRHTGHTRTTSKVIELEDGRLCSCSHDKRIIIWDENYKPVKTLKGHKSTVDSIIEMKGYIVSSTRHKNDGVRIWNKEKCKCIKIFKQIFCWSSNSASKLGENKIIYGGFDELFVLDILSFQCKVLNNKSLGIILSILVLREDQILLGNNKGKIICYDSLFNQVIFTQSIFNKKDIVNCIIESEDKKIISSSYNGDINICELEMC